MDKIKVGDTFTISDDMTEEQEMEVMAIMTVEDTDYVAVSFVEDLTGEENDDIDIFFMKIDDDGDLDQLSSDDEFQKVSKAFDEFVDAEDEDDTEE
ncbi:DUF1292 domain-containing protein [Virgibacillus soli]|uniref:DUF1292 domain-containing protein n=1 Tax=Paracerasibacillus soli TaxID=480284 RepID=A0ABU5CMQ7_9BACI|nr:DUF1292 domain-containing protein [Virgibacillus soli]MDY0407643.1 DUF1292 domain-containing protein [Virgibacillus soli]